MLAVLDVQYDDARSQGHAAALLFKNWDDANATAEYTTTVDNVAPYVPGEFFRRELPCLLAVFEKLPKPLDAIVVDSYVSLGAKSGLGQHLYEHLSPRVPVIGVAKTRFHATPAIEVFRGGSQSAIYVTAMGVDAAEAAEHVRLMHGSFRIPTLLRQVDQLARKG